MKDKEIMRQYYEAEIKKIRAVDPAPDILGTKPIQIHQPLKFCWEDVFGCLVTVGYLFPFLIPEHWFSFGKFLFSFRVGFLI